MASEGRSDTSRRFSPVEAGATSHPHGVAILVLGILSVIVLPLLGPVAWALGRSVLREIDAAPVPHTNRSMVQAGMILGIVGTVMLIVGLVLFALVIIWVMTGDGIKHYDVESLAVGIALRR